MLNPSVIQCAGMWDWVGDLIGKVKEYISAVIDFFLAVWNAIYDFVFSFATTVFDLCMKLPVYLANKFLSKVLTFIAERTSDQKQLYSIITASTDYFQQINSVFPLFELLTYGGTAIAAYLVILTILFIVKFIFYALP